MKNLYGAEVKRLVRVEIIEYEPTTGEAARDVSYAWLIKASYEQEFGDIRARHWKKVLWAVAWKAMTAFVRERSRSRKTGNDRLLGLEHLERRTVEAE